MKIILLALFALVACKKDSNDSKGADLVDITYQVQTDVTGFAHVQYMTYVSYEVGEKLIEWNITTTGLNTVVAKVPRGNLCQLEIMHPNSNKFSGIIKASDGTILKQSSSPTFYSNNPTYYYISLDAAAK
jgi:hypothetical protein